MGIACVAAFVLKRRFLFCEGTGKVCDTVSQSGEGGRMALITKKNLLPPIRAEPGEGRDQPIVQSIKNKTKNKKERIT